MPLTGDRFEFIHAMTKGPVKDPWTIRSSLDVQKRIIARRLCDINADLSLYYSSSYKNIIYQAYRRFINPPRLSYNRYRAQNDVIRLLHNCYIVAPA